eukprot:85883_1
MCTGTFIVVCLVFCAKIIHCDDSNTKTREIASWNNWMTNYRVNEKHDGYLDIGSTLFNAAHLNLTYSVETYCTSEISLFTDGRIYCTANNSAVSYFAIDGSISFFYVTIASACMKNPAFSQHDTSLSLIVDQLCGNSGLNLFLFDAISGELIRQQSDNSKNINPSPYLVGSDDGYVYYTEASSSTTNSWLFAYDVNDYALLQSTVFMNNRVPKIPTICDDKIVLVGGDYIYVCEKAPSLSCLPMYSPNSGMGISSVCLQTTNGYRFIYYRSDFGKCYAETLSGGSIDDYPCNDLPMIYYDEDTMYADIAIMSTSVVNQVIAVKIDGDDINSKELWYNKGNIEKSWIVKNYFVTAWREGTIVYFRIYDVRTGEVVWSRQFDNVSSFETFSVFGGLVEGKIKLNVYIMIRIGQALYAYSEH